RDPAPVGNGDVPSLAPAQVDDLALAREHAAIRAEAFDEANAVADEPRALDLPLRLVQTLGAAPLQVEERDVGVVPGALGRFVRADRDGPLAVPIHLEHMDAP